MAMAMAQAMSAFSPKIHSDGALGEQLTGSAHAGCLMSGRIFVESSSIIWHAYDHDGMASVMEMGSRLGWFPRVGHAGRYPGLLARSNSIFFKRNEQHI